MRIITIGRQFSSGGRELGKRLSGELGFAYYDREIITAIASKYDMNDSYVEKALEDSDWQNYNFTFMHSFSIDSVMQAEKVKLLSEQRKVIDGIAEAGKDFVIVGRNADVLLEKYHPLNLFVCADFDTRIKRCQERSSDDENLTVRQIEQNIKRIDKNRARSREFITEKLWGEPSSYHMVVNTTGWDIKELTHAVAAFAESYFSRTEQS